MKDLAFTLALAFCLAACGKGETPSFENIKGEFGHVKGLFKMRLAKPYRDELDNLQAKIEKAVPGVKGQFERRFAAASDKDKATGDGTGAKLSDLVHFRVPSTESEAVNKFIFKKLSELSGGSGAFFDRIDTEKYVKSPAYAEPAAGASGRDPDFDKQYYLDMIEWPAATAGIDDLVKAATPVTVAVLDTGVDVAHDDLQGALWAGQNGIVGYDASSDTELTAAQVTDPNGHGTHVAGLIAATGSNGKGIQGVTSVGRPLAGIMPVRVLNGNGAGTTDEIAKGLKWAVDHKGSQKLVANLSLGGPFEADGYNYNATKDASGNEVFHDDLIDYATKGGDVLIVVAAGNESCGIGGGCDLFGTTYKQAYYYPCSYENVLCVAASTNADQVAGFSNRRASVGLTAPGYMILSTLPAPPSGSTEPYGYYSGTSQATPIVSGAAALIWALYPQFTANDVKSILQKTASKIPDITGQFTSGQGRLDVKAAMAYAASLKSANKTPDVQEPDGSLISTAKLTSPDQVPGGVVDPVAKSADAVGSSVDSKGKGSAGGACSVVNGGRPSSSWLLLLLLLLPLPAVILSRAKDLGYTALRGRRFRGVVSPRSFALLRMTRGC